MKPRAGVVAVCLVSGGVACGARTGFDLAGDGTTTEPDAGAEAAGSEVDAGFEA